jgi:hypothetical protein
MNTRRSLWLTTLLLYVLFCVWYTNLSGPLTAEEMDYYAERHDYKMGALEKTIAYPVEPILYYSDLRLMLALLLFSLVSAIDMFIWRRS